MQRLFVYNAQNAIIVRGEADRIALAEKIIHDLDKPKSEVVIDVLVLQNNPDNTPQSGVRPRRRHQHPDHLQRRRPATTTHHQHDANDATSTSTTTSTTASHHVGGIALNQIQHLSTDHYSVMLPNGTCSGD